MALTPSSELTKFFNDQPDANAEIGGPLDLRARMTAELEQYGVPSTRIASIFKRIHGEVEGIINPDEMTVAGQLNTLRRDVVAERAFAEIRAGLAARETQQIALIAGLMGANDNSGAPLSAPDALAA
ncbi:MAG TPA: hypothetical protein PK765_07910 [bacterium]|nr:hypothetical protein [bacterium]